jgi:hypothetical protein
MAAEYQVQRAGLRGHEWKTVCRAPEAKAREVFQRQLRYCSVGRFRLLGPDGQVIEERAALPLFARGDAVTCGPGSRPGGRPTPF